LKLVKIILRSLSFVGRHTIGHQNVWDRNAAKLTAQANGIDFLSIVFRNRNYRGLIVTELE